MVHAAENHNTNPLSIQNDQSAVPLTDRRDYFSLVEITVKSEPKNIHELITRMRALFLEFKLDRETVEDLVLLIDEAVTNTAEHAHKFDSTKNVIVRLTIKPRKIQILVKGILKKDLVTHHRFIEFLKRLLREEIISIRKANEFLRELVANELLEPEKASSLKEEFAGLTELPEVSVENGLCDIDALLETYLDERGRGIILIKELTEGKVKVDIIGKTLTFAMTKNLRPHAA
ncbi:MAG: ATP-binding protein [Candidatus Eremiobacteraeota bacterium]|nr:ATP-binding protein [Candidatus Eremiobacteraeota bacterium]